MNSHEGARAAIALWKLRRANLTPEEIDRYNDGDITILFAGQIGGHAHMQAWLQDDGIFPEKGPMVCVTVMLTPTHHDPEEARSVKWENQTDIWMTLDAFAENVGKAMKLINVW